MDIEETNERLKKPLSPAFALIRIVFALFTWAILGGEESFYPWLLLWALDFGTDLFFGLSPRTTLKGCALSLLKWWLWIVAFLDFLANYLS